MFWWIIGGISVYVIGFAITFNFFAKFNGLISPGLIILRSFVWPIYWTTGWPSGERQRMD